MMMWLTMFCVGGLLSSFVVVASSSSSPTGSIRPDGSDTDVVAGLSASNEEHTAARRTARDVTARQDVQQVQSTTSSCLSVTEECRLVRHRPVCGSDGQTYLSKCELKRIRQCERRRVTVVGRGRCGQMTSSSHGGPRTRCVEERRSALGDRRDASSRSKSGHLYVPDCRPDGSYADEQCHNATGYCWCVTPDGKPIPGSSVQGRQPDCQKQGPVSRPSVRVVGKRRRGVATLDCTMADRTVFNANIVKLFLEEFDRLPATIQQAAVSKDQPISSKTSTTSTTTAGSGAQAAKPAANATTAAASTSKTTRSSASVGWKFTSLDTDSDGQLDRKEVRQLRYMVNKIVKPRHCAKTFHGRCDVDRDRRLSRQEWTSCFTSNERQQSATPDSVAAVVVDGQTAPPAGRISRTNTAHNQRSRTFALRPTRRQTFHPSQLRPDNEGRGGSSSSSSSSGRRVTDPAGRTRQRGGGSGGRQSAASDPQAHQQSFLALINSKVVSKRFNRTAKNNVKPTNDLNLQDLHPLNGQPADIDDASQQGTARSTCDEERSRAREMDRVDPEGHIFIPDCEPNGLLYRRAQCHNATGYCWCVDPQSGLPIPGISTHNVTPDCSEVNTKRLKGCPPAAKKRFLTELLDNMTQEMVERATNGSVHRVDEPDPEQSIEERAVRWKLHSLDVNNNNVLERSELKGFKADIRSLRGEEKYARKCRRNFLQYCDDDNNGRITLAEWIACTGLNEQQKQLPENHKRRGPNPFSTVLKS